MKTYGLVTIRCKPASIKSRRTRGRRFHAIRRSQYRGGAGGRHRKPWHASIPGASLSRAAALHCRVPGVVTCPSGAAFLPGATSQPGEQLYIFRDSEVVFYVGKTQMRGSARAYEHWCGGFRANDRLQEFLQAVVDDGLDLTVEFWSIDDCKAIDGDMDIYDIDDAEQCLINQHCPVFNAAGNVGQLPEIPGSVLISKLEGQEAGFSTAEPRTDSSAGWLVIASIIASLIRGSSMEAANLSISCSFRRCRNITSTTLSVSSGLLVR